MNAARKLSAGESIVLSALKDLKKRDVELAPKQWRLWDVVFRNRPFYKDVILRVRARDEQEAIDTANEIVSGESTVQARRPDRKRRKVYVWEEFKKEREQRRAKRAAR
jgi:hypothetical protein